jgi:hypothetical protein
MVLEPVVSTTGVPTKICVLKGRLQRKSNLPARAVIPVILQNSVVWTVLFEKPTICKAYSTTNPIYPRMS